MQRGRGQWLLIVAISAVVAGVLLIVAGLMTMNDFQCRPGQAGSLSVDAAARSSRTASTWRTHRRCS